jgi:hypothetical protein
MINYSSIRLAVCMPTREQMHSRCTFSLYNLALELTKLGIENKFFLSPGTLIANQRDELVKVAKEWSATHVMFIDSDIVFEPQHVIDLLEFDEPIVGAAYSKRLDPIIPTAWHEIDNWNSYVRLEEQTDSHIQVDAMALGFCLINVEVFDAIQKPWFILGYRNGEYTGEDIEFFRNCNQNDIPVWLDVKTSLEIGHLGIKEFRNAVDIEVDFST